MSSSTPSWIGEGLNEVVVSELKSLKADARVYTRKSGLFFLTSRDAALKSTEQQLKAEHQEREQQQNQKQKKRQQ